MMKMARRLLKEIESIIKKNPKRETKNLELTLRQAAIHLVSTPLIHKNRVDLISVLVRVTKSKEKGMINISM